MFTYSVQALILYLAFVLHRMLYNKKYLIILLHIDLSDLKIECRIKHTV